MQVLPNKASGDLSALVQEPQLPRSRGALSRIMFAILCNPAALLLACSEPCQSQCPELTLGLIYLLAEPFSEPCKQTSTQD